MWHPLPVGAAVQDDTILERIYTGYREDNSPVSLSLFTSLVISFVLNTSLQMFSKTSLSVATILLLAGQGFAVPKSGGSHHTPPAQKANYKCASKMVSVNVKATTTEFKLERPKHQSELIDLFVDLFSTGSTLGTEITVAPRTLKATYKIATELCVPKNFGKNGSGKLIFATHGYAVLLSSCLRLILVTVSATTTPIGNSTLRTLKSTLSILQPKLAMPFSCTTG